ncbi:S-layer homology domain-containing protein, partial [Candidatus Peregrinibacteria bacterium]|nr:S-layer homology domain-containing protein [Candidatus Peregrinibacteria bacterium]
MNILRTLVHKGTAVLMSIAIVLSVAQPVSAKSSSADDFFKAKDPFSDIFSSESSTSSTSEQIQVPEPPQGFEDVVRTNSEFKNPFYDTDPKTLQGLAAAYAYHVLNAVGGYSDGSFRGDEILNRAGLAKIILIARYGLIKDDDSKKNNGRFGDMLEKEWYRPYMMMAVLKGILRGYPDGTMRPAAPITTAEATKIAVETFNLPKNLPYDYLDVFSYDWFAPYAGAAQAYNFFPLRNSPQYFEPQRLVTRFGLVVMIYQILKGENTVPTPEPLPPIPQPLPPVPMPSTDDYVLNGTMTVGTNDYSNPEDIAITPDGKTAVVSLVGDGTLEYIDISPSSPGGPHTVREIHSGSSTETEESPTGIAIIPDSTKILVAETIGDFVLVMNSSNLIVERAISTEGESSSNPEDIAITPDGTKALVTLPGEGAVGVFTPSAYRLDRKIQVGGTPTGIAITPDGKKALVADNSSEQILVLNLSDYSVSKRISVGKNPFSNPEDIAIAPDGKRAFVTLVGDGNVEVIDLESSSVVRTINVGGSPTGITVAPNGKKIYVANNQTEKIQIIDVVPSTQPLPPIPVPPNECTLNVLSDMNETVEETGRKAVSPWMHPTWTASIPGAKWIWKSELVEDPTDEETYTFTKNFSWTQSVYSATLKIAADNSYEVWLNGTLVGADASENNFQIGTQDSYNVAPALVNGTNTLKIRVKNLSGFADPYSNPAGLLYSLNIQASNCGGGGGYPIPEPLILKARLSPDTPPSQEFPADVVNVPVLKIQLTASSSEALHISDVGITDNGNGKIQDAGLVKIFDGDNKLGVSSGDYDGNLVWIHLSPRFDIPAGTTKTMTVGIERHAWNTYNGNNSKNKKNHIFSLHAANHISAKGDSGRRAIVLGQFPIKGNKMTFGKTPDQGNSYPIISAFSGPEYLKVGEIGEWKITARDPKNGPLTYSVTWGDEGDFLARPSTSEIMASFNQTVTLTHSYQKAGKYNPRFVVTNNAGLTAETTVEVKVGILSPNNLPPVISGISAPTVLQVGQEGTLKVTASDPENGPLTYTVVWGDEPIQIQPYLVNQTATFSHTYSRAGTYTPTV